MIKIKLLDISKLFYFKKVMLDNSTKKFCEENSEFRDLKIKNIEHAITQAELMINESKMSEQELIFLKKRISESRLDLEILYLMRN